MSLHKATATGRILNPTIGLVVPSTDDSREGVVCGCVVHIAETDEQKCSRRFTAATTRIATGDASIAGPASVPKKGRCAGAVLNGSGRVTDHLGRDGGKGGRQHYAGSVKWNLVEWILSRLLSAAMWTTLCRQGSSSDEELATRTVAKIFSVSAGPATATSSKPTTSCAWGISLATWRFFAHTILICCALSGHWQITVSEAEWNCQKSEALARHFSLGALLGVVGKHPTARDA